MKYKNFQKKADPIQVSLCQNNRKSSSEQNRTAIYGLGNHYSIR